MKPGLNKTHARISYTVFWRSRCRRRRLYRVRTSRDNKLSGWLQSIAWISNKLDRNQSLKFYVKSRNRRIICHGWLRSLVRPPRVTRYQFTFLALISLILLLRMRSLGIKTVVLVKNQRVCHSFLFGWLAGWRDRCARYRLQCDQTTWKFGFTKRVDKGDVSSISAS